MPALPLVLCSCSQGSGGIIEDGGVGMILIKTVDPTVMALSVVWMMKFEGLVLVTVSSILGIGNYRIGIGDGLG